MKKLTAVLFLSLFAITLTSCKKGSVSGKVIDPFTGQAVQNATVWVKGTPKQTKTPDGSFKFDELKPGEYQLNSGKNKWSESHEGFTITEKDLNVTQNIYIFPQTVTPGMYRPGKDSSEKLTNLWLNWESACKESLFGYRTRFIDTKTKKPVALPDPTVVSPEFNALYYQATSVNEKLEIKAFPMEKGNTKDHADCQGFDKREKIGYFPVVDQAIPLESKYKSENLTEITGKLPKGKQALAIMQGNKVLKAYFFDVQ